MARWIGVILAVALAIGVASLVATRQSVAPAPAGSPGAGDPAAEAVVDELLSENPELRGQAISAWSAPIEVSGLGPTPKLFTRPAVVEALAARATEAPDEAVRELGEALAGSDLWVERFPELHARYLTVTLTDPSGEGAVRVIEEFNRFDPVEARELLAEPIAVLARHENWKVRYHAADYVAHYLGVAGEPILVELTRDPRGDIQRRAWLALSAMRTTAGLEVSWREMPPKVAEAAVLAVVLEDADAGLAMLDEVDADGVWADRLGAVRYELRRVANGEITLDRIEREYSQVEAIHRLARESLRAERLLTGERADLLLY